MSTPFLNTIITGTGSHVPENIVTNQDFAKNVFLDPNGIPYEGSHQEIADRFKAITGIEERRYADSSQRSSDLGSSAAERAITDAAIDREEIDYIIVAHNFGDVVKGTIQTDAVPSLASRIKHNLGINNPSCVAFDILFGCPGWIQGLILSDSLIRSGQAKRCLVIGTETLSRVIDMRDRDSMIYSDGAGACIIEGRMESHKRGIISSAAMTHAIDEAYYLFLGKSNAPDADPAIRYIKMHGRKIYEYALTHVPAAMKKVLEQSGYDITDLKKIFIHQANEKMDFEILKRFYRLYKIKELPEMIMPMTIHKFGNSSVATIPTLFDLVRHKITDEDHSLKEGDLVLFASVGAGMNVNAIAYKY